MAWPAIFNPSQEEAGSAGGCWSYLTALDHLLGTELQGPLSAFLADFTELFPLRGWVQAATTSLGEIPRKPGKAADSHFCEERGVKLGICSFTAVSHLRQHENTAVGAQSSWAHRVW